MQRLVVKCTALVFFALSTMSFTGWHYNLDNAKAIARKEHKLILLTFSGSDWCAPCIRLHKEIFENETFQKFADTSLVLVNADFPRLKKNKLPSEQQKINETLADKYNSKGSFPLTILLDENGDPIKEWEGYPKDNTEGFIKNIQFFIRHYKLSVARNESF